MKINCVSCGHKIELDDVYDDYEGLVKCVTCRSLLDIKTQDGRLLAVRFGNLPLARHSIGSLIEEIKDSGVDSERPIG
jgi:hypothetical protein